MADDLSSIFKGSAVVFLGTVIQLSIGLISTLLFARYLGPSSFGGLSVGIAIATTGASLLALGMNKSVPRYIPRFEKRQDQKDIIASALHWSLACSIGASVLLFLSAPFVADAVFNNNELTYIIQIFSFSIPVIVLYRLCNSIFQGLKRPTPKVILENLVRPILYVLLIAYVIIESGSVIEASVAYITPWVVITVIAIIILRFRQNILAISPKKSRHKELLIFSLPLVLSVGMQQIFNRIDIFFIGAFSSVAQVGIYSAIYPVARTQLAAIAAINFIYAPVVSKLDSESDYRQIEEYYRIMTKWLYIGAFPVIVTFALNSSLLISTIFGPDYSTGSSTFVILLAGFFISLIMGPTTDTLVALGNTRAILFTSTGTAVLNIILNTLLIPSYGIIGAAVATAISYISLNGVYLVILYRSHALVAYTRKQVVAWLLLPFLLLIFNVPLTMVVESQEVYIIAVFTIAAALSAITFIYFLEITEEEKELIKAGMKRMEM